MSDDLRIYNNLKNYFVNKSEISKEEEVNNLNKLWNERRGFVNDTLINYSTLLAALSGQGTGKKFYERYESLSWPNATDSCQPLSSDISLNLKENYYLNEKLINDIFDLALSPNYIPPSDLYDLQDHLVALMTYCMFADFLSLPVSVIMQFDFAILKVITKVERFLWRIAEHGIKADKNIDRISKIIQKKKIAKDNSKQLVLELFFKLDTSKMTKNKIATTIKEILEKESNQKSPGINTIKRYLIEEKCPPFA